LAYAGSLVGATVEVDKTSVHMSDYGRVKIVAKDIIKMPAIAEGAIITFLYDFLYEREVLTEPNVEANAVIVPVDNPSLSQPSPKKMKTGDQTSGQDQLQFGGVDTREEGEKETGKHVLGSILKSTIGSSSPPTKLTSMKDADKKGYPCEVQKFQYKADVEELLILNSGGERVQGLFGEGISISKEDIISDEAQGDQTTTLDSKGSQTQGVAKCSYAQMVLNKQSEKGDNLMSGAKNVWRPHPSKGQLVATRIITRCHY
jgi:hypothetical protein